MKNRRMHVGNHDVEVFGRLVGTGIIEYLDLQTKQACALLGLGWSIVARCHMIKQDLWTYF